MDGPDYLVSIRFDCHHPAGASLLVVDVVLKAIEGPEVVDRNVLEAVLVHRFLRLSKGATMPSCVSCYDSLQAEVITGSSWRGAASSWRLRSQVQSADSLSRVGLSAQGRQIEKQTGSLSNTLPLGESVFENRA